MHQLSSSSRRGFTLVEMLIVCGIILMVMLLAIPTIRVMTGGRSLDAGGNTMAAFIARAREEAVGKQRITGVLFFHDIRTDRTAAVLVEDDNSQSGAPAVLDSVASRDIMYLPFGVGLEVVNDGSQRYIGYNYLIGSTAAGADDSATPAFQARVGGVILFDMAGRLVCTPYLIRLKLNGTSTSSTLGLLLGANLPTPQTTFGSEFGHPVRSDFKASNTALPAYPTVSNVGFTLYDLHASRNVTNFVDGTKDSVGGDPVGEPAADTTTEEGWLDANGVPYFVNRYNGTLIRGE